GEQLGMSSGNLGLFTLIPIPGLDGSRLIFLIIEAIRRKPVPQRVEAYVHMTGYVLLMGLMLVMTYKDVLNIIR
ncbi:MAG: site-2 protease family protein, partial [Clostridia bacterium]|nr:site-2 protease family protein [Clostridia bacterium]